MTTAQAALDMLQQAVAEKPDRTLKDLASLLATFALTTEDWSEGPIKSSGMSIDYSIDLNGGFTTLIRVTVAGRTLEFVTSGITQHGAVSAVGANTNRLTYGNP